MDTIKTTVDSLLARPEKSKGTTIAIKGLVTHTCKKSGKKIFLTGSSDSLTIKVFAGKNISQFDVSLEREKVIAICTNSITEECCSGEKNIETHDPFHKSEHDCSAKEQGIELNLVCTNIAVIN